MTPDERTASIDYLLQDPEVQAMVMLDLQTHDRDIESYLIDVMAHDMPFCQAIVDWLPTARADAYWGVS